MPPVALNMTTAAAPDASLARPRLQDVLPYVALPILLILSLFSPPFPGRSLLFVSLIAVSEWGCTTSPWPPTTLASGSASFSMRPLRYGLAGSWIFVLPVLEKLLIMRTPETDCWHLDEADRPPDERRPRELSWRKLRWAISLVTTPRGVGWNFGSRGVNAAREAIRREGRGRAMWLVGRMVRAFLAYVAVDAAILAARKAVIPQAWEWTWLTLGRIMYLEALMMTAVYATMTLQFEIAAAIGVGLLLNRPEVILLSPDETSQSMLRLE